MKLGTVQKMKGLYNDHCIDGNMLMFVSGPVIFFATINGTVFNVFRVCMLSC